ncbi:MAG TPA: phosphate acetyltransferase, partial [Candidatus Thioglobus sp.]|nr:phosphate acetyltransferase [Candidatus Thioglobus sp.]
MALVEDLTNRAKVRYPRILLPESNDARVLEAAKLLANQKIAKVVLLDAKTDTTHGIEFINPEDEDLKLEYAKTFY